MSRSRTALVLITALASTASIAAATNQDVATYRVRFNPASTRLVVSATVPMVDTALAMDVTRPAGIPELDSLGWAGLVTGLRVTDAAGRSREVLRNRTRGWKLAHPEGGTLRLEYEVDYAPLARLDWPAPREAAYRDSDNFVVVGRSLFVTTTATRACRVTFEMPRPWYPQRRGGW